MLREPTFYVGLAAGAVVAWLIARRRDQLVVGAPHYVKPITRRGRMGQNWPGGRGGGAWR